jgi:hypothetical protein
MSEICHALIAHQQDYDPATFKWNIGRIDQLYQRERYTPIYNPTAGVVDGRLIDRPTFESLWEQQFERIAKAEFSRENRNNMKLFDFLTYCTLVAYSNGVKDLHNIPFEACSAEKYQALQQRFHQKSFVNEERKVKKTIAVLDKRQVDIIFLQETNQKFRDALRLNGHYHLMAREGIDSCILIRKDSFRNCTPELELEFATSNWNEDSLWCRLGRLILISVHLSSKKEKNEKQVAAFLRDVHELRASHPEYHLLIGIDANSFIDSKQEQALRLFPTKEEVATTYKERTWIQAQVGKANVVARSCKDHLISDLSLLKCEVTLINGANLNVLIPTEAHPYDHYLVSAQIHTLL